MRKLNLFDLTTLDGYFEGRNQDISQHNVDTEFDEFAIRQLDEIGTLLFGRVTYQLMSSYWPNGTAIKDDPVVAEKMNSLPKIVISRTLKRADQNNTRLSKENLDGEVSRLKSQFGKDISVFGSSNLSLTLIKHELVDEFRIVVNPEVDQCRMLRESGTNSRKDNKNMKPHTIKKKTKKKLISSGTIWEQQFGYSRAVRIGDVIAVAGTTAVDESGNVIGLNDPYTQAKFIYEKIDRALHNAGASLKDVVRVHTFVIDISRWEEVAKAQGEIFAEIRPAATLVQVVGLVQPELLVEIEVDAIIQ